jgi:peptidoglycan/LPS O-acetylase OafA/YrhL
VARWKQPVRVAPHVARMAIVWGLGLIPGLLYIAFNPDGIPHPDRFSIGPWLSALKYTPLPHLASFVFGAMLADLDQMLPRPGGLRAALGLAGFAGSYVLLALGPRSPYALMHDGLLMPLFGCIVLGLAGENPLATLLGLRPLVFVGEASYCMYLLHFNLWNLIHDSHVLDRLGVSRFDPWISYAVLIGLALLALHLVEKPAQRQLRQWMGVARP